MGRARQIFKKVKFVRNPYEAARGADALAVLTDWSEFNNLDFKRIKKLLKHPVLIDGRNMFNPNDMKKLGFQYVGMGRNL